MTFYVNPSCAVLRNNKQHVGRESINAWKKADFDGFREKVHILNHPSSVFYILVILTIPIPMLIIACIKPPLVSLLYLSYSNNPYPYVNYSMY